MLSFFVTVHADFSNSAIFGAGATLGSNIVNRIF